MRSPCREDELFLFPRLKPPVRSPGNLERMWSLSLFPFIFFLSPFPFSYGSPLRGGGGGGGGGEHSKNLREAGEFHHSPLQVEVRYLPPYRREGGTLENVVELMQP